MKVAAIQMVSSIDSYKNESVAKELLLQASSQNAELVVLPENFLAYGAKVSPTFEQQREFLEKYSLFAKELNICIVAGTFPIHGEVLAENFPEFTSVAQHNLPYAACVVFGSQGQLIRVYTKMHLFDADVDDGVRRYCESNTFRHGESPQSFGLGNEKIGLGVCYDLRFSRFFQYYFDEGTKALCLPSAFTAKTGTAHWEVLVRARAIENQSYLIAANQGGLHDNNRESCGKSMIVDPWGKILACKDVGQGIITADIDFDYVVACRKAMPIAQHTRLK